MIWAILAIAFPSESVLLPSLDAAPAASIAWSSDPLVRVKHAPFQKEEYRFEASGRVDLGGPVERFRIFSQTEQTNEKLAKPVARELLRIWQLNFAHFGRDHAERYNRQLVDVYLCETGEPGGEQLFALDPDIHKDVNAIFIYDLKSFTEPIEMAREVAHEYGHATLPPVGGYKEGESWINGEMGETLYLRSLRDELKAGHLDLEDTMGATLADLQKWVSHEVDPLVLKSATRAPGADLAKSTLAGRAAFLGLAAYSQSLLPVPVWRRSLTLFGSIHAEDYLEAMVEAVGESEADVVLSIPQELRHTPIWIPFKNKKAPGVRILAKVPGWLKIDPAGQATVLLGSTSIPEAPVKISNP